MKIEQVGGDHVALATFPDNQPAAGASVLQPETGVLIQRMTDVSLAANPDSANPPGYNGSTGSGLTNPYSRVNHVQGEYWFATGTTPLAALYKGTAFQGLIKHGTAKLGEPHEIRWEGPGRISYYIGSKVYEQAVGSGIGELVYDFGIGIKHTGDGSRGGKVRAYALNDGTVRLLNWEARALFPYSIAASPNGVDVSPDGKWLKIDSSYYTIGGTAATLKHTVSGGHGGWALLKDGAPVYVQQNNATDWIDAFNPATGERVKLMRLTEALGPNYNAGIHVASTRNYPRGWALVSTYSTASGTAGPLGNNIFWLELTAAAPRIIRVAHTQTLYAGQYFAEAFAAADDTGAVWWGSNWHGKDNLEVYRAEITAEMRAILAGETAPDLPPDAGKMVPITSINRVFTSADNLADDTAKYEGDRAVEIIAWRGGRSDPLYGGEYDIGALLAASIPADAAFDRATLALWAIPALSRWQVNGIEGMAVRAVRKPWQPVSMIGGKWMGGSHKFAFQTANNIGTPWSNLPSAALWPKWPGDLPTVLEPVETAARMNWPVKAGNWIRVDVTAQAKAIQRGEAFGFYIDPTHMLIPADIGEKRIFSAGFAGEGATDASKRPRIELSRNPLQLPTPTPTPSPTPKPRTITITGDFVITEGN